MESLSVQEFSTSDKRVQKTLRRDGRVVLTSEGKPSVGVVNSIGYAEAMSLISSVRRQAAEAGLDKLTMDDIDAEIQAYRLEKKATLAR
ncbi:hypothetical protein RsTz2092_03170 [Deferribacterales bacterium RsTz2092]|nr:hypothetical protein AGMMS49941_12430 [Deferribacterales bacterium]